MKRAFVYWAAAVLVAFFSIAAQADAERATEAEAEAMLKKAVAYYKKNGRSRTFAELIKSPGPFVDRDLYLTVFSMDGVNLAHINPKMVGKNLLELRDIDGKLIVKERVDAAQKASSGWQDYKFYNPVSKKIEPKRMYWERHDDIVFACGAYKKS